VLGGTTVPGGKPVIAEPGETPRFPLTTLDPVLVTVEPPKTAKLSAVPRLWAFACTCKPANATIATIIKDLRFIWDPLLLCLSTSVWGRPAPYTGRDTLELKKKADAVQHQKLLDRVGLLYNEPPDKTGLPPSQSSDKIDLESGYNPPQSHSSGEL